MSSTSQKKLFPILLVNFIGTLGFSIVLPFLVILVLDLGGNEVIYGFMGATYSFFQLIGAPILGRWSDQIGRKKVLLISQSGTFIAWVIFFVALVIPNTTLEQFDSSWLGSFVLTVPLIVIFIARALDGITGGNISVANAYLSDISNEKNKKKNFGKMSAAANIGFVVGPALAGVMGGTDLGHKLPVLAAMLISLLAIFVIYFRLQHVQADQSAEDSGSSRQKPPMSFRKALLVPHVPFIVVMYFLIYLAFNFFYVAFPVHSVQTMGWDMFKVGVFFTILSGVMVIIQGPVLSYISNYVKEIYLILAGSLILACCFYLFTVQNDWVLYTGAFLFAVGNGIMWPSFLSILSTIAGDKYQGVVQGYGSSAGSLASIIGLVSGGFLYARMGASVFMISVGIFALIGVAMFIYRKAM